LKVVEKQPERGGGAEELRDELKRRGLEDDSGYAVGCSVDAQ
jgi:hypothetical protein